MGQLVCNKIAKECVDSGENGLINIWVLNEMRRFGKNYLGYKKNGYVHVPEFSENNVNKLIWLDKILLI